MRLEIRLSPLVLPLPFMLLVLALLGAAAVAADSFPQALTPVDLLARSANHTIFVRLLQRSRIIPTINNLILFGDGRGITILAPTNDAFLSSSKSDQWLRLARSLEEESEDVLSNSNELLRQQLLYHILNFTLPFTNASAATLPAKPVLKQTLHFPSRHLFDPAKPDDPKSRPWPIPHPPAPPFMPGFDPDALLGSQGQVLRISSINLTSSSSALVFGSDHQGRGGVIALAEDRTSDIGVVVSVNGVLDLPPKLEDVVHSHPALASLSHLFPPNSLRSLSLTPHLTLFAPASPAFDVNLSLIERSYLFDSRWKQALGDRFKLLGWHSVSQGIDGKRKEGVIYADDMKSKGNSTLLTILGGRIDVTASSSGNLSLGASHVIEEDIIIENGVIHVISNLILPYPTLGLGLTVEKTLLGLNASKFVDLMYSAELESYLTRPVGPFAPTALPSTGSPQDDGAFTFVVPRDDLIDAGIAAFPKDKKKLSELLKYHISPGALLPANLTNGQLVGTELRNWKLKEGRQRVVVSLSSEDDALLRKGNGDVSFGGVNVIADPVQVGPALIYLTAAFLTPPSNPIQTAVSSLELSTFVAAIFSAHLDSGIKGAPGVTYLIPSNAAFENLGLVMPYLLSGTRSTTGLAEEDKHADAEDEKGAEPITPRDELRSVVEFHAIDDIVYLQDFAFPSRSNKSESPNKGGGGKPDRIPIAWSRYPTLLDGSHIWAGRDANGTVRIRRSDPNMPNPAPSVAALMAPEYLLRQQIGQAQKPITLRVDMRSDAAVWPAAEDGGPRLRSGWRALSKGSIDESVSPHSLLGPDDQNDAVLKKADMLTNTGVIHEISRVELPETLDITIGKLMVGAKANTMIDLIRKAGYGWILNGSTPTTAQIDDILGFDSDIASVQKSQRKKRKKREERRHKRRHKMFRDERQAYILLCPTDAAFSRINLTKYLESSSSDHDSASGSGSGSKGGWNSDASSKQALKRLIQLHIVPLTPEAARQVSEMNEGTYGGKMLPLALDDRLNFPSLLDKRLGGASSYGSVSFRRLLEGSSKAGARAGQGDKGDGDGDGDESEPNLGWMVGVQGTRGSVSGKKHVAKVVGFGRENLGLVRRTKLTAAGNVIHVAANDDEDILPYPSNRVAGGVLTIDAVLEEYHPGWWYVWGWIVALCVLIGSCLGLLGLGIWKCRAMREGKIRLPEALEGEED